MDIKEIKKEFGLSQKDLAKFFEMSYGSYANSSAKVRYENAICQFYEVVRKAKKKNKMIYAINLIKDADCEDDVLNTIAIKEELNWLEVDDELKDQWNDYFGDAKKHLP